MVLFRHLVAVAAPAWPVLHAGCSSWLCADQSRLAAAAPRLLPGSTLFVISNSDRLSLSGERCRPPTEVKQGYVVAVQKTEYEAGFEIHYLCKKNFLLDGPQKVTCLSNGNWSESPPFCRGDSAVVSAAQSHGADSSFLPSARRAPMSLSSLSHPGGAEPRGHRRGEALALRRHRRHGPSRGKRHLLLQTPAEAVRLRRRPDLLRREAPASGLLPRY